MTKSVGGRSIRPHEYLGFQVTWDLHTTTFEREAGPGAIRAEDDKILIVFPEHNPEIVRRVKALEFGSVIRVTGIIQEHTWQSELFEGPREEDALIASDFTFLRHDVTRR